MTTTTIDSEVFPYITALECDGLIIAAIVEDFQFVEDRTDKPTIRGSEGK